jgi:hypothetical protein
MIVGSGWVNLLSGQIRLHGSDLASLRGAHPRIRWAVAPTGWATWATRVQRGRLGRAADMAQKLNLNRKSFFLFSNLFYELPINLNSNQI